MDTNLVELVTKLVAKSNSSHETWILIIAATAPSLAALAAYLKAKSAVAGIEQVHLSVNSRLDELLKSERKHGVEEGRSEERKDRQAAESKSENSKEQTK